MLTLRAWTAVILTAIFVAVATWSSLQVGLHLWQDHQDHHLVLELLRYNIQQGRLVPLTAGSSSPPPAAGQTRVAPEKPPAGKGK